MQVLDRLLNIKIDNDLIYVVYDISFEDKGPGLITESLIERKVQTIDMGRKEELMKKYPNAIDTELVAKKILDNYRLSEILR
jgi:hypothetical protein